jgi:hypothetical protein
MDSHWLTNQPADSSRRRMGYKVPDAMPQRWCTSAPDSESAGFSRKDSKTRKVCRDIRTLPSCLPIVASLHRVERDCKSPAWVISSGVRKLELESDPKVAECPANVGGQAETAHGGGEKRDQQAGLAAFGAYLTQQSGMRASQTHGNQGKRQTETAGHRPADIPLRECRGGTRNERHIDEPRRGSHYSQPI